MEAIRHYFNQFLKLSDREWDDFAQCLKRKEIAKKEWLLEQGQTCDFLAFIESGLFRFYTIKEGEEKITGFFFSGDFVSNYRSFLTGKESEHYIESMQESVVFLISKNDLQQLYDKHHHLERLGRFIAENLYLNVAGRLDSFMFDSPKERYEALLRRNSKLLQEIPQYMLASYLGVKPETISRIRGKM
jgi:CRP-like cAMP-binding protein